MKSSETINTTQTPPVEQQRSGFADKLARIRAVGRTMGRFVMGRQAERPVAGTVDVGKMTFRGYMAHMDRQRMATDPSAENRLRLEQSETHLRDEQATYAELASRQQPAKEGFDWMQGVPEAAPAVIGGRFGNQAQHPQIESTAPAHETHDGQMVLPAGGVIDPELLYGPQQPDHSQELPPQQ